MLSYKQIAVIDLGPEGGVYGGEVVFEGSVSKLLKNKKSYTGKFYSFGIQ